MPLRRRIGWISEVVARLSLFQRTLATALLGLIGFSVVSLHASRSIDRMDNLIRRFNDEVLATSTATRELSSTTEALSRSLREIMGTQDPIRREVLIEGLVVLEHHNLEGITRLKHAFLIDPTRVVELEELFRRLSLERSNVIALLRAGHDADALGHIKTGAGQAEAALSERLAHIIALSDAESMHLRAEITAIHEGFAHDQVILMVAAALLFILLAYAFSGAVTHPLNRLREAMVGLSRGRLDVDIPFSRLGNEMGQMGRALERLRTAFQHLDDHGWVKSEVAAINQELQQATNIGRFAELALQRLCPSVGAMVAAFYLDNEDLECLSLAASHGMGGTHPPRESFRLGEGLIGECARSRQTMDLNDVTGDEIRVFSGLIASPPRQVLILPVYSTRATLGVIELGFLNPMSARQRELLEQLLPSMALTLEVLLRMRRTESLVRELQEQSEELDAQQRQLKTAEAWYRGIIDAAPDCMLVTDAQGMILLANPRTEAVFGYSAEALAGQPVGLLIAHDAPPHPSSDELAPLPLRAGADTQGRHLDGTEFPLEVGLSALPGDYAGRGICYCVVLRDITARRDDEKAAWFTRHVLEISGPAIWIDPQDCAIRYANKAMADLIGQDTQHLLGMRAPDIALGNSESLFTLNVEEILSSLGPTRIECRLLHRDGHAIDAEITLFVTKRDGDPLLIGTVQDISLRKASEAAMYEARAMAEETSRMKSDFLANMSHEIRTPMNAIMGMSHLALMTELTPRQRDYLRKIQQSSQHLLGIINDILDISKIEAGKLSLERTHFELESMLARVVSLIAGKAADKGIELVLDVAGDVPVELLGDSLRLEQILINYANNAVKFTEAGEIDIRVSVVERAAETVRLQFSVRDSGIGMTPDQISRLFQPFQQADNSTTRIYGGTGLGLSIARRLAELMDGEVGVESAPGVGSTFWFTARLGISASPPVRLLPTPDLRGNSVLVVDDNDNARHVLTEMLRGMSFSVAEAVNGQAGIEAVRDANDRGDPYDLVLLDWHMPGMNGIETARAIQRLKLSRMPRMLMITAFGREDVYEAAQAAGIPDVLVKPVGPSVLFDTVMHTMGAERRASAMRTHDATILSPLGLHAIAGSRLLLVEDNDMNQEVALELLGHAGMRVDLAENGREAVEMLREGDYDLVLMDMQMPVMDGIDATRAIRTSLGLRELPIVAMTANALPADRQRCIDAGMNDFLAKPIEPEQLWKTLSQWISPAFRARADTPSDVPANESHVQDVATHEGPVHIDHASALRRLLGNRTLYQNLLKKFVTNQSTHLKDLQDALAADEQAKAERLAHDGKTAAGNLGANALRDRAATLESALREGLPKSTIIQLTEAYGELLGATCIQAEFLLDRQESVQDSPRIESDPDQVTTELERLLCECDPEAASFMNRQGHTLRDHLPTGVYDALAKSVAQFDFTEGLSLLRSNLSRDISRCQE